MGPSKEQVLCRENYDRVLEIIEYWAYFQINPPFSDRPRLDIVGIYICIFVLYMGYIYKYVNPIIVFPINIPMFP